MGKRLTKIYTRKGDKGRTGLGDGTRIDKDHPRIAAIGDIDELNSAVGVLLAQELPRDIRRTLTEIQHLLFDIGAELSVPGEARLTAQPVSNLEKHLEMINATLPPLREFILPGGAPAAAHCHLARTVCRRAERKLVALNRIEPVNAHVLAFLNRLADLLFVMARLLTRTQKGIETQWRSSGIDADQ